VRFGALGKIAGNQDDVGPGFADRGNQGLHGGGLDTAEVRVQ